MRGLPQNARLMHHARMADPPETPRPTVPSATLPTNSPGTPSAAAQPDPASLPRHAGGYLLVGGIQWLLDWAVMVLLSHLWLPVAWANICGRISGAVLGYWLNGRYTFAAEDTTVGRRQFLRFLLMWLATTAVSTWAVTRIDDYLGLKWAWLAKPLVEVALGLVGFFLSRHWVYKKHD